MQKRVLIKHVFSQKSNNTQKCSTENNRRRFFMASTIGGLQWKNIRRGVTIDILTGKTNQDVIVDKKNPNKNYSTPLPSDVKHIKIIFYYSGDFTKSPT